MRFQLKMALARFHLATTDFTSGLGGSAWVLHGLVRSLRPDTCVEIGSAKGASTCHIGLALRENVHGRLYAIDPHIMTHWNDQGAAESLPILLRNLRTCGVENYVEVIRATSEEAARAWLQPIDLLFIDGDHSYSAVRRDWELFSPFVAPFGVVLFHDTLWELQPDAERGREDMGVPRFVEELRRDGYPVVTLARDFGLTLVQPRRGGVPLVPA